MRKLSNSEAEFKKSVSYEKSVYCVKEIINRLAYVRLLSQSSSFCKAPPKLKRIYYKDAKEIHQMIFPQVRSFCLTGG